MGNLGWDSPKDLLTQRASQVLSDAGIQPSKYKNLVAMTGKDGKGSAAELCFETPADFINARPAIRELNISFIEERHVWMDAKKTRASIYPARIVHRMAEVLADIEATMTSPSKIVKFLKGKFINVGGQRVGHTMKGEWKWTARAISNLFL